MWNHKWDSPGRPQQSTMGRKVNPRSKVEGGVSTDPQDDLGEKTKKTNIVASMIGFEDVHYKYLSAQEAAKFAETTKKLSIHTTIMFKQVSAIIEKATEWVKAAVYKKWISLMTQWTKLSTRDGKSHTLYIASKRRYGPTTRRARSMWWCSISRPSSRPRYKPWTIWRRQRRKKGVD